MTDILKYEARKRLVGTLALGVGIGAFALLIVYIFPSIEVAGDSIQAYVEALPEVFQEGFAIQSMTTIEGFLATEVYQFVWVLMLGLYLAYVAGGVVAADVETGRIDLLLATPVSRKRVVVEKYLSLLSPIVALNLLVPVFVYGATVAIGESLDVVDFLALHVLSVPYLLVTAAIGLALSVVVERADFAQRGSLALIFALFVLDTVTTSTDLEVLGVLSPTKYYAPGDILVDGTYDVAGAAILLVAALVLLVASAEWFQRTDV
jgi:ABC-2 type transport system permease protein